MDISGNFRELERWQQLAIIGGLSLFLIPLMNPAHLLTSKALDPHCSVHVSLYDLSIYGDCTGYTDEIQKVEFKLKRMNYSHSTNSSLEFTSIVENQYITKESPAKIKFTLQNTEDYPLSVFTGAIPPFSTVRAENQNNTRILLWNSAYQTNEQFTVDNMTVRKTYLLVETPMEAGESMSRTYTIPLETRNLEAGNYTIEKDLYYNTPNHSQRKFNYSIDFTISKED